MKRGFYAYVFSISTPASPDTMGLRRSARIRGHSLFSGRPDTAIQPVVWLDELGGAHIMVNGDVSGAGLFPPAINNSGVAVGGASTSIPIPGSPVIDNPYVVPNPTTIAAVAWQGTVAINLGTLPGGYYSFANNISNSGLARKSHR